MQHQRDIARLGRSGLARRTDRLAREAEFSGWRVLLRLQPQDRNAEIACDLLRRGVAVAIHDHRFGAEVGQVEGEFLGAIARIERRRGGARADRDEGGSHFRAVRQHDGDAVVAADAQRVQLADRVGRQVLQFAVGERPPLRRADGRIARSAFHDDVEH